MSAKGQARVWGDFLRARQAMVDALDREGLDLIGIRRTLNLSVPQAKHIREHARAARREARRDGQTLLAAYRMWMATTGPTLPVPCIVCGGTSPHLGKRRVPAERCAGCQDTGMQDVARAVALLANDLEPEGAGK